MMLSQRKRAARSRCGLYDCSACNLFLGQKCPGCASGSLRILREGGTPCAVYTCTRKQGVASCIECWRRTCLLAKWPAQRCPLRARYGEKVRYENFRAAFDVAKAAAAGPGRTSGVLRGTVERLRSYLHAMNDYERRGVPTVSSHHLGRVVGVKASLVRRDLSGMGHFGRPGGGYQVPRLRRAIMRRLSLERSRPAVWLGANRLTRDKGAQQALDAMNCHLAAVFDADPSMVGATVAGLPVQPLERVTEQARVHGAAVAILASDEAASPEVVQALVRASVNAFLNLTPIPVPAGSGVVVEQGDLGSQLSRLLCRLVSVSEGSRRARGRARPTPGATVTRT